MNRNPSFQLFLLAFDVLSATYAHPASAIRRSVVARPAIHTIYWHYVRHTRNSSFLYGTLFVLLLRSSTASTPQWPTYSFLSGPEPAHIRIVIMSQPDHILKLKQTSSPANSVVLQGRPLPNLHNHCNFRSIHTPCHTNCPNNIFAIRPVHPTVERPPHAHVSTSPTPSRTSKLVPH